MAKVRTGRNPCRNKGRYLRTGSGHKLEDMAAGIQTGPNCECSCPYYSVPANPIRLIQFKISNATINNPKPELFGKAIAARESLVVPCDEFFLNEDSAGTKKFKRNIGTKTKFKGCQDVEDWLAENGLINYELNEAQGLYSDMVLQLESFLSGESSTDGDDPFLLSSPSTFLFEIPSDTDFVEDLEEKLTEAILDLEQSDKLRRLLKKHLRVLTPKQRKALNNIYLKNFDDQTQIEVAAKMKLSIDSLKDRREQAFKKLKRILLADDLLAKVRPGIFKSASAKTPRYKAIPAPPPARILWTKRDGTAETVLPTKKNPIPFGAHKARAGINSKKIRAALFSDYLLSARACYSQSIPLISRGKSKGIKALVLPLENPESEKFAEEQVFPAKAKVLVKSVSESLPVQNIDEK